MNPENSPENEIVVGTSFDAAEWAACERMWALTLDERLDIHERLMHFIYPDGQGDNIEPVFEVIHL